MRMRLFAMVICLLPATASAQAEGPTNLAGLLPRLILRDVSLPSATHAAHFSPLTINDPNNPAVKIVEDFNKQLVVQLSTVPLGSSSGGFTYTFDPAVGTFSRASRSFGPAFAERALTAGRHRFSAGMNYQHLSYKSFESRDLDNGSLQFYLRHQECCTTGGPTGPPTFGVINQPNSTRLDPFFEGDLIRTSLSLKATTDTVVFFGNYGITNQLDVGLAVPVVKVSLDATMVASILRLATGSAPIHTFEPGNPNATERSFTSSGSASGLGDIVVRSKYRMGSVAGAAVAAAIDVRLPTGDQDNLLGAGTQTKLLLIASHGSERWGQHANVGYSFAGGKLGAVSPLGSSAVNVPDEFNYTVGMEYVAESRVTLVGDIVGRVMRDTGRLTPQLKTFEFVQANGGPTMTAQFEEFDPRSGSLHVAFGTAGVKFNPAGSLLINANVVLPLTKSGLRSRVGAVIGIDYAF
jgi:hypothetical protein